MAQNKPQAHEDDSSDTHSAHSTHSTHSASDESTSSEQPPIPSPPRARRESSIRFSEGTKIHSQSPMSNFRHSSTDSDEITPIRHSDGNSRRQYNTTDTSLGPESQRDGTH